MIGAILAMATALPAVGPMPAATPIVIGHRGASGERPEHTIASYARAIEVGADYIEPDLVMTKDGVMVARHENEISGTTDVALHPEFAGRKTTKIIDGRAVTGWFTEDFKLAELKTLFARERLADIRPGNLAWSKERIPTLAEILALVKASKRVVGLYPEIKHSTYFAANKLAMEKPLIAALRRAGFTKPTDPVFIQSFEIGNLRALHKMTSLRLVQLIEQGAAPPDSPALTSAKMISPAGLREIATYAQAIGPQKSLVIAEGRVTDLVRDAHAAGLLVHPWTFRAENMFMDVMFQSGPDAKAQGDLKAEIRSFYAAGVDGVFSDFPGEAVAARRQP
jgi:glycerophosphoryl diester phosphodiesterase